ncbi:MAG: LuxR C-terminal-related transcriptional regulator [Spirochaetaceae bacterium]|jgi:DNA-binding NarL/FixJ family response regulator|nr:LuxR C-terminal-related transcriptional regulator [Spirochaetaceae bacterium]
MCELAVYHENPLLSSLLVTSLKDHFSRIISFNKMEDLHPFISSDGNNILISSLRMWNQPFFSLFDHSLRKCKIIIIAKKISPNLIYQAKMCNCAGVFIEEDLSFDLLIKNISFITQGRRIFPPCQYELPLSDRSPYLSPDPKILSTMERGILTMYAQGYTLKEAAIMFKIRTATAATYKNRVSVKLGLYSRRQLYRYARGYNLI